MIRTSFLSAALAGATAALCTGCPTDTGNPFTSETRLHAHSSDPDRVGVDVDAVEAKVTEVWLGLGALEFHGGCGDDDGTSTVPAIADHALPAPQLVTTELTDDSYCGLGVSLHTVSGADLPAGAPTLLIGHSILVGGVRIDAVPFTIRSTITGTVDVRAFGEDSFALGPEQPTFLGFDVATWLVAAVDLAGAVPVGGIISIEAGVDDTRLAAFEAAFPGGVELYDDPDASGSAGAGEAKLAKGTELSTE